MKLFLPSILFFAIASFAPNAFGQSIWTGTAGDGLWATPGNWSPAGEPTATTDVTIASPATIALPNTATSVGQLEIDDSVINLNASASTFSADPINVRFGGTLNLNIPTGGTVTTVNTFFSDFIGDATGTGTFILTGGGTLNMLAPTNRGTCVGIGGTGVFTQSGTVAVTVGNALFIGADGNFANPNSIPAGSTIANGGNGTYTMNAGTSLTSAFIEIGVGSGTGGGTTTGGATPTVGLLNINGGTVVVTSSMDLGINGDDETMAVANTTGSVNQSAGSVTIDDFLTVGASQGAIGNYTLSGSGTLSTPGVIVGSSTGSNGAFVQSGGTTVSLTGTGLINGLFIGGGGTGSYDLQGGTITADPGNPIVIGDSAGSNGTLTQEGGTITSNDAFTVGNAGTGSYTLSSGGTLNANAAFNIGTGGGNGDFIYKGGALNLSSGVTIGATGTFDQDSSITLTNPATQAVTIASGGSYNLNSGTLTTGGSTVFTGAGNFNFAGGTVAVSGSDWFDTVSNGIVSGGSTIDTTGGNATLSGNLTGTGTLRVIGGGTVSFIGSNNSTAGWGINVADGTVIANAALFPSSGAITIGSGGAGATGTVNLAVAGGVPIVLTGNLTSTGNSGTGMFNVNFATVGDTLELAGHNNYSGTITLGGGGTLELFNGTYGNIGGTGAVGIGDPASLTSGTVTLAGTNSYNGPTTVNNNFTLFTSNLTGDVNVQNLGTFGSGLTPSTLPAVQTTTVALGGEFNSTGTIRLASNGIVTDLYTVTGTSTLSGRVLLTGIGTITNHVFISSPAGLDTAGLTLVTSGAGVLFTGSIQQVGTTEQLTTTQIGTAAFAETPNELAVAGSIDPVLTSLNPPAGFLPLGTALNNLPASAIPGALEELTPESLQYSRMICFENSTYLVERMNGVDADLRGGYGGLDTSAISVVSPGFGSNTARSLGSLLASNSAFHQPAPNGVNYYPGEGGNSTGSPSSSSTSTPTWNSSTQVISDSPNPYLANQSPSGPETPGFSEFISGDAVLADLNQNQSTSNAPSSKASYTAEDAAAGVSFRMNSHLAAGVLFDYNHTDAKTDGNGSKTHVDSYEPGLFATYFDHGFYANGLFSFGYNNYSNTRDISFMGDTATSHPTGQQYIGDLDFGYDFHPDKNWVVGPTLGVTYTHLDIDSFSESGAPGADLTVDDQSADSLRSRLGGHVVFQTNTGDVLLQPNLTAMWQHEYLDNGSGITSSFNDFSANPFTIQTAAPSRDSALIGVGLTATLNNSMALYFNYLADVGASNYFAQSVVGGFKARF
jgi:uncharacterized protein YhjY with autotransporter beta-barrel domain